MVGDFEMPFPTKTKVQARPGDVRVLSDEEYVIATRRLQRENDAANLRATIARMARDAASPATGKSHSSRSRLKAPPIAPRQGLARRYHPYPSS
jgi:hypothetical protein